MAKTSEAITGSAYGRLTIVGHIDAFYSKGKGRLAKCVCSCGVEKTVPVAQLGKSVNSCGCLGREVKHTNTRKHGLTGTREYNIWLGMWKRVTNPEDHNYLRYSKLGIDIPWNSFENFIRDMGPSPSSKHTLERINNDLGYSAENCRWATVAEQARNKRNNVNVTKDGATLVLKDAAAKENLQYKTVQVRLSRLHWPIEKALGPGYAWADGTNPYTKGKNGHDQTHTGNVT